MAAGLRTGRHRALAAVLFAVTLLCHLIPAIFAGVGAGVWLLLDADVRRGLHRGVAAGAARRRWSRRLTWGIVAGAIGVGLTAFWLIPFATGQAYTTNMGWTNVEGFPHLLAPASARWVVIAAAVGVVAMLIRRNRVALFIAVMGGFSAAVVCLDPQGKLYNVRFLPLWFLCLYLMAGYALAEVVAGVARWNRRRRLDQWVTRHPPAADPGGGDAVAARACGSAGSAGPTPTGHPPGSVVGPIIALAAACLAVVPPLALPASTMSAIGITVGPNQPSAWAEWNYSGYQGKPDYPEYHAVIQMMAKVGTDQGCGRAMWEYDPSQNRFGTTMSLMLLPYWTNGCVDSMEGLLFESSATTPFHFINQNELSVNPSDAVNSSAFQYMGLNVPLGIQHLQLLGVRYFLASSTTVEAAAAADPNLTQVASSGPWSTSYNGESLDTTWKVYEIKDSSLVTPLANRPVVWTGVKPAQTSWLQPAATWYDDPSAWKVVPAAGGPADWTRVPATDTRPHGGARAGHHGVGHLPDRQLGLLPRRPGGNAGRGQGVLLPQLAGPRGRRSVAGGPQPDGGGADQPRRDPRLRQHRGRQGRGASSPWPPLAGLVAVVVVGWRARRTRRSSPRSRRPADVRRPGLNGGRR